MRRSPFASQILAAATTAASTDTAAAVIMSSRPPYRGGSWSRGRRSFSDRPFNNGGGGGSREDQLVSGDSHFRSVRDANLGSRHGGGGGGRGGGRRGGFSSFNPRPHRHHPPPPQYFNRQPPPPPLDRRQLFHQSRRPTDYRGWEYSKSALPPGSERFVVLSYNILADYLASNHRSKLYFHIPRYMLDWEWRKRSIMFELGLWSADIMCFQEVDKFQDLEEELKHRGYSGIWKMRTGNAIDGCAIFWRSSRFKMVHEESIEFNKLGMRDNVAQICVLELVHHDDTENAASPPVSSTDPSQVVICNIHVLYNPKRGDFKLGQVRTLLERAHAVSRIWNNAPIILCGDFNCTPKSPLYNFILEQKLDLSGLDRDKVSGQASAEIRSSRPYNPNSSSQSASSPIQVPSLVDRQKVDIKTSDSLSEEPRENNSNSNEEHLLSVNLSQPEGTERVCIGSSLDQVSSSEYSDLHIDPQVENTESDDSRLPHEVENPSSVTSLNLHDFNSETSSGEQICQTSSLDAGGESLHVSSKNKSSQSIVSDKNCSSSTLYEIEVPSLTVEVDYILDKKLDDLSLQEQDNPMAEGEGISKDDKKFLAALHGDDSVQFVRSDEELASPNDEIANEMLPDLGPEPFDIDKTAFDPSSWTPIEIATATGNPDCTLMQHPLRLKSTYAEVEDSSKTRDSNGEPIVTSYNRCFMGTVDYIWRSEGLQTVRVLAPMPKNAMQWTPGFPTKKWGSDHIALASELALVKDHSGS